MNSEKFKIEKIKGRWILDSRGNPTIEVEVRTKKGIVGLASVPSGASTGKFEALELRDGGEMFHGKGVFKAIKNIEEVIAPALKGKNVLDQKEIDEEMIKLDGTKNKSKLGANAILGVSLAISRAAANTLKTPLYKYLQKLFKGDSKEEYILPLPLSNVFNAGKHGGSKLEIQEFMLAPIGANNFHEGLRWLSEVYQTLRSYLVEKYGMLTRNVGDEGGFSGPLNTVDEVMDALVNSVEESGYTLPKDFVLAIDSAASEFYNGKEYIVEGKKHSTKELIDYYVELTRKYPLASIEDPFDQEDWSGFIELTKKIGGNAQVVGDDHLVTNIERIKRSVELKSCNSLLLKVNQVGTLTEALEAARYSLKNKYSVIVSHRSGETEDSYISDLAVGIGCGQIKTGAPARGERTAKYNRLLRIEEREKGRTRYAGPNFLSPLFFSKH